MVRHGTAPYGTIELDDIDRRIIETLSRNARASYTDMGKAAGISPTAWRGCTRSSAWRSSRWIAASTPGDWSGSSG